MEHCGADADDVLSVYGRALEIAAGQEAKLLGIRATTSCSGLLKAIGRSAEARETLGAALAWFEDGVDTPDLIDARTLLGELG